MSFRTIHSIIIYIRTEKGFEEVNYISIYRSCNLLRTSNKTSLERGLGPREETYTAHL